MEAAAVDLAVLVAEFLAVSDCLMVVAALVSFAPLQETWIVNQTMSYLVMILVLLADCSVELQRQAARTHCLVATIAADYLSLRWKRFL